MLSPGATYRFGPYELRARGREVYKHGRKLKLRPQPFQVLQALAERPGDVVTREELRGLLWPAETFVDFEHGLNTAIKELRRLLNDSASEPRYIQTVPRLGYRFVAPVETVLAMAPPVEVSILADGSSARVKQEPLRLAWQVLVGISIFLIGAPSAYFTWSHLRNWLLPYHAVALSKDDSHGTNDARDLSAKSAEAHDLYLKGMYFWNKRNVAGFQQAIEYFQQATTANPNYALAYTGLANSYTLMTAYSSSSATFFIPQARAAAARALQLDPNLAEGHTSMALIVQNHNWDWQTSEQEYRRAIELNPNYATAHHWYAEHLMWLGRFDEALACFIHEE